MEVNEKTYAPPADELKELRRRIAEMESEVKRLREGETRYRVLFEDSRDAIYLRNRGGELLDVNQAMLDLFGYSREEMIGVNVRTLRADPAHMERFEDELEQKGAVRDYEERLLKKDGEEMPCLITSTLMRADGGRHPGYHGIIRDITKRKKHEAMLRVQANAMASAINAIVIIDLDENLTYVNPTFLNLWGYKDEREVLGKSVITFWQDEGKASEIKKILVSHGNWVGELKARRKDGRLFDAQVSASMVRDERGKPLSLMASFMDISENKIAEEALRQSEEKFRLLFEKSADAVLLLDNGRVIDCNQAALDMMGCTDKTRLLGLHTYDISPERQPDGRTSSDKAGEIRSAAFREGSLRFEWTFRKMDGREFPADVSLTSIPLGENRILYSVFRDISVRKRAEEKLRKSEKQLAEIINFLPDATWAVDGEGRVTVWNREAEKMTGVSASDLLGKGNYEHALPFYGDRRPMLIDLALNPDNEMEANYSFIEREGNALIAEVHGSFPGKEEGYFWGKASPICGHNGEITGAIESVRDITGRKKAEEEKKGLEANLLRVQRMEAMGVLAGGIAHDFNNILTALLGYAELALFKIPEKSEASYSIDNILKAGYRAKDLVSQILAFSRQTEHEKQPVRIGPILKEALKLLRASLPRTIRIQNKIVTQNDTVMADPTQIHQVVMNLCTNAHHAMMEKGGTLGVRLNDIVLNEDETRAHHDLKPGPYVRLTVSDTGQGMESDLIKRIFDPYFTTKAKGVGTGLGLSVVHGIVKDCGGTVFVQSKRGKGSTFTVLLPSIKTSDRKAQERSDPIPRGSERILFVDDEEFLADLEKRLIGHLGYDVTALMSSIQALETFRAAPDKYDLVITDMTMPGITGEVLTREIMKIRPDIPVILCTGFSERMDEERALGIGARAFVMKPMVIKELGRVIRRVLDEPHSTNENKMGTKNG